MVPDDSQPRSEREQTNESLRTERQDGEEASARRRASNEVDADEIVDRARKHADDVLSAARGRADLQPKQLESAAGIAAREAITRERTLEDNLVRSECAAADVWLRAEREEQVRVLLALRFFERDKTDRYLLTERARSDHALANRDDFLSIVSHDLRNLLSGIVLSANAVTDAVAENDDPTEDTLVGMARIQRYAARMNRLIGDLSDVVSIDTGKLAVRPVSANATTLIAESVDAFALAAAERGVSLVANHLDQPLIADFDNERMFQVLGNLITNALKFTARGGHISVRAERLGADLRLSVRDTGSGIPGDLLDAVFERFWQVGKNDRRGLGLGLYISKCIVESHGGRIWVESVPGKGSEFHLTIPGPASTQPGAASVSADRRAGVAP